MAGTTTTITAAAAAGGGGTPPLGSDVVGVELVEVGKLPCSCRVFFLGKKIKENNLAYLDFFFGGVGIYWVSLRERL